MLSYRFEALIEVVDVAVQMGDSSPEVRVGLFGSGLGEGVSLGLEPGAVEAGPQLLWRSFVRLDLERGPPG